MRLAALEHRPWEHSTGPRTLEGRLRARENAFRHGGRALAILPLEAQRFVRELQLAEAGFGPLPNYALARAVFHSLVIEACSLQLMSRWLRYQHRYTRLVIAQGR